MDTGSYMANQMDDLITSGFILQEQMFDELYLDIENYIQERHFTFNVQYVFDKFRAKRKGEYTSWSVNQVIQKFYDRLQQLIS